MRMTQVLISLSTRLNQEKKNIVILKPSFESPLSAYNPSFLVPLATILLVNVSLITKPSPSNSNLSGRSNVSLLTNIKSFFISGTNSTSLSCRELLPDLMFACQYE